MRGARDPHEIVCPACEHGHGYDRSFVTWYDATGTPTDEAHGISRRCLFCGLQQSLGPSNDDIPTDELAFAVAAVDIVRLWEPREQSRELDQWAAKFALLVPR